MSAITEASTFCIRPAVAADAAGLLQMMRELAAFEGYLAEFRVNVEDLLARGLDAVSPQFRAYVAATPTGNLLAYAVLNEVAFTYDLRPDWRLKELYVTGPARQLGVGRTLMQTVIADARQYGCGRLKWDVLPGNSNAKRFYRQLGGEPVKDWEAWVLQFTP
ncbi:GNAT family N-acetyltransferase [Undibacterium sp. TJN19]|uniref:GNAT family N-acetyltransferase n=1 Tax=Undibacterium sp. TJN19 TaxID=3413055 RepID=UPI003BF056BC